MCIEESEEAIEVTPLTLKVFDLFHECSNQFNYVSNGMAIVVTGLNYPAVNVVLNRLYEDSEHKVLFKRLLIVEDEFLAIQAEE